MAPLTTSLDITLLSSSAEDGTARYAGALDAEWTIGSVPNGGYSLSAIINCAQQFLRLLPPPKGGESARHVDPMHVSATYLAAAAAAPYEVSLRVVKRGRAYTHLEAGLWQVSAKDGAQTLRLQVSLIMTSFSLRSLDTSLAPHTISSSSPFFAPCPLRAPRDCTPSRIFAGPKHAMEARLDCTEDVRLREEALRQGKLRWGAWLSIERGDERRQTSEAKGNNCLALADMSDNPEAIFSAATPGRAGSRGAKWYPTMHLALEFKRALPYNEALLRAGVFMRGRFLEAGQGEVDVELWSHPGDAAALGLDKDESRILLLARQVCLCFPLEVNRGINAKKEEGKGKGKEGAKL